MIKIRPMKNSMALCWSQFNSQPEPHAFGNAHYTTLHLRNAHRFNSSCDSAEARSALGATLRLSPARSRTTVWLDVPLHPPCPPCLPATAELRCTPRSRSSSCLVRAFVTGCRDRERECDRARAPDDFSREVDRAEPELSDPELDDLPELELEPEPELELDRPRDACCRLPVVVTRT